MTNQAYMRASDGNGNAALAHLTANRLTGSLTYTVDNINNWPNYFIATCGTLDPDGMLIPNTTTEFRGHKDAGSVIIDTFEPGYTDNGNTAGQVLAIKQTTGWANLAAESVAPTGAILPFAGANAPAGWLLADGSVKKRADYPWLFNVLGTAYNTGGEASTDFRLPNMKGRVVVGMDAADADFNTLGKSGGAKRHTLTEAEMPIHNHEVPAVAFINRRASSTVAGSSNAEGVVNNQASAGTSSKGGGQSHNNLQPFSTLNYIVKT